MFSFTDMKEEHLPLVLSWRTSEEINNVMLSDVENDIEQQRHWFARIKCDERSRYWIIEHNDKPIGVLNQSEIDLTNKRCIWGFYIGDEESKPLGGLIPPYFYNHVFSHTTLIKITAEVLSNNKKVMKLHRLHGYRDVGVYLSHICKKSEWLDLHLFELHKDDWKKKKRFTSFFAHFA